MKRLTLILLAVVALMSSCKKDKKENPQPLQSYSNAIFSENIISVDTLSNGWHYVSYNIPSNSVLDSIYLSADRPFSAIYHMDYTAYSNVAYIDYNAYNNSMYNIWIEMSDTSSNNQLTVTLPPNGIWYYLKVATHLK
jgi:hypothetical protein